MAATKCRLVEKKEPECKVTLEEMKTGIWLVVERADRRLFYIVKDGLCWLTTFSNLNVISRTDVFANLTDKTIYRLDSIQDAWPLLAELKPTL